MAKLKPIVACALFFLISMHVRHSGSVGPEAFIPGPKKDHDKF